MLSNISGHSSPGSLALAGFLATKVMSCLSWDNLNVFVEEKQLLSDVSGHASPGRLMAVMGASGAGKSTFLSALAGLLGPKVNNFILSVIYCHEHIMFVREPMLL